jgi:hypothetical protein
MKNTSEVYKIIQLITVMAIQKITPTTRIIELMINIMK